MKKAEKNYPNARLNLLCLSVCYIAIGVVLLAVPSMSLHDICYALGIVMMIAGIVNAAVYFIKKSYLVPGRFGFSTGVVIFLVGLFAVWKTQEFSFAFSQILALCMLFDSIVKLQFSTDLLRMKNRRWWAVLAAAILMGGLSMAILINPFAGATVRNQYTYIVLIADGVVNMIVMLYLSRSFKKFHELSEQQTQEDE